MDQIDIIKNRLSIIKNTHPNLYTLWNTYIDEKIESMLLLLSECRNTLNLIENENVPDLSQENIITLLMFMTCNNERDMT